MFLKEIESRPPEGMMGIAFKKMRENGHAVPEIMLTQQVTLTNDGIYTLLITDSVPASLPLQYLSIDDDPN